MDTQHYCANLGIRLTGADVAKKKCDVKHKKRKCRYYYSIEGVELCERTNEMNGQCAQGAGQKQR